MGRLRKNKPPCSELDCDKPAIARGLCQTCYNRFNAQKRKAEAAECSVEGCSQLCSRLDLCSTHYGIQRKAKRALQIENGALVARDVPLSLYPLRGGYLLGYAPDHPLAMASGSLLEHRRVAYNKYGAGTQSCHWCDCKLEWKDVQVDHLDWVRENNHPDNLVTSCVTCNNSRKSPKDTATEQAGINLRAMAKRLRG